MEKKIYAFGTRRLVGAMIACIAVAVLYNVVVTPYLNKTATAGSTTTEPMTTTTTESVTETTVEITSETTTQTTTRKVAAPVTKVFKPKTTSIPKVSVAPKKVLLAVPFVSQLPSFPTGCEAASATMLLQYYGYNVGISTMVSAIPRENLYAEELPDGTTRVYGPSIYEKFVGDPRMTYTSETPGYGAFAPVVTSAMNQVIARIGGNHIAKNITGASGNTLLKYLDSGDPVIVWSTARMKTPTYVNSWYIKTPSGDEYFEYPRGTHVTVLIGYDAKNVYMADPYYGNNLAFSHEAFLDKYALLGKQAIVIEKTEGDIIEEVTTSPESTTSSESTTVDENTTVTETSSTAESTHTDSMTDNTDIS